MNKEERKKYIFAQLRSLPNTTQYVEVTKYFEDLEQQVEKQKEVINKIQMVITDMQLELMKLQPYHSYVIDGNIVRNSIKDLEDILKEVINDKSS